MNELSVLAWLAQAAADPGVAAAADAAATSSSPWLPYLYQYLVGGGLFFLAIITAIRKGALDLTAPADRRLLRTLVLGLAMYALLHGGWIYWATGANAATPANAIEEAR